MPFGRAPDLEVDGTIIAGSVNILRFLGMKFGKNRMTYNILMLQIPAKQE